MIQSLGQVMLYVADVDAAAIFWKEQVGFERVEKQVQGPQVSYILAPTVDSEVAFVLHDKAEVAKMNPEMNLGTPSILMTSKNVDQTYKEFVSKGITANPVMDLGFMRVFNFADNEGNYFAVREVN